MKKTIPAVSIIIPMYNRENYIRECIDSILAQTFTDYEVIVVDDCSTDNSVAIVESYLPKFGDKLKLIRSDKNSNGPAIPRNIGMTFSRGEYIMFVDSDDAITPTAIEEIYPIAKKFDADVLHCEKCYISSSGSLITDKRVLKEEAIIPTEFVTKPTLMTSDPIERLKILIKYKFDWTTWQNFVRRDFVMKHEIRFPDHRVMVDTIFAVYLLCLAKKIVCVPNVFYVYRFRQDSTSRSNLASEEKNIAKWGNAFFKSVPLLEKFMDKLDIFANNMEYKYALFDFLVRFMASPSCHLYSFIPAYKLDKFVRRALEDVEDKTTLLTFLFAKMSVLNLQANQQKDIIYQMNEILQNQNQGIQQNQAVIQKQSEKIRQLQTQLENSRNFLK